jgi:hypothetical protein
VWRGSLKLGLDGEHRGRRGFYQFRGTRESNTLRLVLGDCIVHEMPIVFEGVSVF